jgi:hypothetical protein
VPQAPQLAGSAEVSMQEPLQFWVPGGHEQAPLMQTSPDGQACPQLPQFAGSCTVSTQAVPHFTVPGGQVAGVH